LSNSSFKHCRLFFRNARLYAPPLVLVAWNSSRPKFVFLRKLFLCFPPSIPRRCLLNFSVPFRPCFSASHFKLVAFSISDVRNSTPLSLGRLHDHLCSGCSIPGLLLFCVYLPSAPFPASLFFNAPSLLVASGSFLPFRFDFCSPGSCHLVDYVFFFF